MPEKSDFKDALDLLINDHRNVQQLFEKFKKLGDGSTDEKQEIADQICKMLTNHAELEEELFYPKVRDEVK
jgi:hemerythrin superfamily protein